MAPKAIHAALLLDFFLFEPCEATSCSLCTNKISCVSLEAKPLACIVSKLVKAGAVNYE